MAETGSSEFAGQLPEGTRSIPGIIHRRSPHSITATSVRLIEAIEAVGAKVFAMIDQAAEADSVGLTLRPTKLLIFGNPAGGTPLMGAVPSIAVDLPLKLLVWSDDLDAVWVSYVEAEWLADRHGVPPELIKPLLAVGPIAQRATAPE
jgi:uncharacterized protein (DUF302 family)